MRILHVFLKSEYLIVVPGEEAYCHLYHSGVVGNSGRHDAAITLSEAAQAALQAWEPI